MRRTALLALGLGALLTAGSAAAEVQAADDSGFDVAGTQTIDSTAATVWAALVRPSTWWENAHTWSGKAANLSLDPRAGGCFCERLPRRGGVEHMRVIRAEPGKVLVMVGALGPLQSQPVQGVLTVQLETRGAATVLSWRYAVSGLREMKGGAIAAPVNGVISAQFASLGRTAMSRSAGAPRRR
ncbi:ATPase [Novosphingobium aquiterrae]|uniref:ATPase n=1 Tax=Novosphingobium aquiterrae TaxID=624388 RepID=A0ABV6PDL0_9SPHN